MRIHDQPERPKSLHLKGMRVAHPALWLSPFMNSRAFPGKQDRARVRQPSPINASNTWASSNNLAKSISTLWSSSRVVIPLPSLPTIRLMLLTQRNNQSDRLTANDFIQLVQSKIDAMVGDPALREVISRMRSERSPEPSKRRSEPETRGGFLVLQTVILPEAETSPARDFILRALILTLVTIPVGRCVSRTAESVVLTCYPPRPRRNVSTRKSSLQSRYYLPPRSRATATVQAECECGPETLGTRCTRCAPDSNFRWL